MQAMQEQLPVLARAQQPLFLDVPFYTFLLESPTKQAEELPPETEVLIIGGGIQGAGIAQASAAAGYQTVLVEMSGWAAGTSSKSSKLIHGGLRYLDQFQLGLVYESLKERDILCRIAPHLVRLNRFYIPVYKDTDIRPWKLRAGLSLYAILGGLGETKRFATIPRHQWKDLDGLNTKGLQAVFRYFDGQTDDAALTRAVIESAKTLGATVSCPTEFLSAHTEVDGYHVAVQQASIQRHLRAKVVINVAGPWSNIVAERISPPPLQPEITLVQGSHIVLDQQLSESCFYLESPRDRRAVFILPWKGQTLVGTTETPYQGDPSVAACSDSEKSYLQETVEHYFPQFAQSAQIAETMAGLRVLPHAKGDVHHRTRDVMIHHSFSNQCGYINVCGGKLTGYRATATAVQTLIQQQLGERTRIADTSMLTLPHGS